MRFAELEPRYLRIEEKIEPWTRRKEDGANEQVVGPRRYYCPVTTIAEADGVKFLCPKCFQANGGVEGSHIVICWRPKVAKDVTPGPGRCELVGTSFEDMSLVSSPTSSVQLYGGCNAHFTVSQGNIIWN